MYFNSVHFDIHQREWFNPNDHNISPNEKHGRGLHGYYHVLRPLDNNNSKKYICTYKAAKSNAKLVQTVVDWS